MLLKGKVAIVFGAAGYLGQNIIERFASEGAQVFAAGSKVSEMKSTTTLAGKANVDTTDEAAVDAYLDGVVAEHVKIDIVVNVAAANPIDYNHGHPASDVTLDQLLLPMSVDTAGQFITAKSVYRHMARQGSGVVIFSS